jgi:predicted transcriptional regulator
MKRLLFGFIVAGIAACGGTQVPTEHVAQSEASIRAAEEVGAKSVPTAALHLQLAKEQFEQAKVLIKNNENERAKYVLARAAADAELAVALARESAMHDEAQKAYEQVQSLQGTGPN